jgi:putative DNA primase/helicase
MADIGRMICHNQDAEVTIAIGEGVATVLSVHEATGHPVVAALSNTNLKAVTCTMRTRYPDAEIVVLADLDNSANPDPLAQKACHKVGAKLAVPDFGPRRPDGAKDFNDLHAHAGLESVRECIANATVPLELVRYPDRHSELEDLHQSRPSGPGQASTAKGPVGSYETTCLADVEPERFEWFWQDRIALGKINMIAGHPGLGKSQIAATLTALATTGGAFPDGTNAPFGSVVVVNCEDDLADTLVPRLEAADADRRKVHTLDWIRETAGNEEPLRRSFDISRDVELLRQLTEDIGDVVLVVIDPVSAYLGATDSNNNSDVRSALMPLQVFAAEAKICVILISHLNKGSGGNSAISRVTGSMGFQAVPRSSWLVGPHPQDETRRVLVPIKNNIGNDKDGFTYRIETTNLENEIVTSRVVFDAEPVLFTADEVLKPRRDDEGGSDHDESALGRAISFLKEELAGGARPSNAIIEAAKDADIPKRTLERAKGKLGVKSDKVGQHWEWKLPDDVEGRQEPPHQNLGDVGGLGGVDALDRHSNANHPQTNDHNLGHVVSEAAGNGQDRQHRQDRQDFQDRDVGGLVGDDIEEGRI